MIFSIKVQFITDHGHPKSFLFAGMQNAVNAKITITIATENFNDCFCFFVEVEWAYSVSYSSIDSQTLILDSTLRVWLSYLYFWQPFKESYYLGKNVAIQVYITVLQLSFRTSKT